jgi:hypothetical protein
VNAIYVYDDKLLITFNYKDSTKTISLKDIEGSDLNNLGAPKLGLRRERKNKKEKIRISVSAKADD